MPQHFHALTLANNVSRSLKIHSLHSSFKTSSISNLISSIENIVDRYVHARQDSLSTVSSSVAAELIRQSEIYATQNNVRIGGQQTFHVGDVLGDVKYNIYTTQADLKTSLIQNDEKKKDFRFVKTWRSCVEVLLSCALIGLIGLQFMF